MGCPEFARWRVRKGGSCEQDMAFVNLTNAVTPQAHVYGVFGCGQLKKSRNGRFFPLTCWQDWPLGKSPEQQMAAIREIAALRKKSNWDEATEYCSLQGFDKSTCRQLWRAR